MTGFTRSIVFIAMLLLTLVSMWTTYVSVRDSVLPEPAVDVPLGEFGVWHCSVFALALSVAIGLMLFALKIAVIDGQKRLNAAGIIGMAIVAFISITFNMDVLYRTADREFYMRHAAARIKGHYASYLASVRSDLLERRAELEKAVAAQEAELDSEIEGLREAPAGFGVRARQEAYRLNLLQSETQVELRDINDALEAQERADETLESFAAAGLDELDRLQDALRVAAKDAGAYTDLPLPEPIRLENPLFAVFARLLDPSQVGLKEIFFLTMAVFLDLGDIIGYSLVPNKRKTPAGRAADLLQVEPAFPGPEYIGASARSTRRMPLEQPEPFRRLTDTRREPEPAPDPPLDDAVPREAQADPDPSGAPEPDPELEGAGLDEAIQPRFRRTYRRPFRFRS